jgi:AcrR family transcriptional regulator
MGDDVGQHRTRRSSQEVRELILMASEEIFSERGYSGASTRDLAARAGVAEHLIFRNFGTKAKLFEEAVFVPFDKFITNYARVWSARDFAQTSMDQLALEYVSGLYDFFHGHRKLFRILLSTRAEEPAWADRLQELFGRMEAMIREGIADTQLAGVDAGMTARLTFGLVLSAVLHEDLLFPPGSQPTRDELLPELTKFMMHGVAHGDLPSIF